MLQVKYGWQYRNEISLESAKKTRLSVPAAIGRRLLSAPHSIIRPLNLYRSAHRGLVLADECYSTIKSNPELMRIFALLELGEGYAIQEVVIPIRDLLGQNSYSEQKIVRDYFMFVNAMFSLGVFEYTFNLFDNFGFDARGKVKLIDIGEFCQDRDALIDKIRKNNVMPYSLEPFKWESSRNVYLELHSKCFSVDNIEEQWGSRK